VSNYRMHADFCAIQAYQTHPHPSDWKELGAAWQLLIKVEERLMVDRVLESDINK
jgi:hypothetical protein